MTLISVKLETVDPNNVRPSTLTQQHSQHQQDAQQPQHQVQLQQPRTQQPQPQQSRPQQPQIQQLQAQQQLQVQTQQQLQAQTQQQLQAQTQQQLRVQQTLTQPQQPQSQQPQTQQSQPQQTLTQQPQTQQPQTQQPLNQQRQAIQPHMSNLKPMHPSVVRPAAPTQSHHTIIKTEPRQHVITNNNSSTCQPSQQLKPNAPYTPAPPHANTNTIAVARTAANITIPQHHQHLQHHQHQQQTQPPIMHNTSSPNTIIKPSKKRITKRGSITPTVTMATTNNPTNNSSGVSGSGSNSTTTSTGGENTGRWTAEEHRLFLQGLEQHGKGWKKIASLIKSRTVVQIRTHAQKYFQKLAKARQNGEEGEVSMEGRGNGPGGVGGGMGMGQMGGGVCGGMGNGVGGGIVGAGCHGMGAYHASKRRRQTTGTKRKAIQSVVASMQREAKRLATDEEQSQHHTGGIKPLPAIAPVLTPFIYQPAGTVATTPPPGVSTECVQDINGHVTVPSITTAHHGTISGSALEDSLFRFLTPNTGGGDIVPLPNAAGQQLNNVARQAGANPITVPCHKTGNAAANAFPQPQVGGGNFSPTGVDDIDCPNWVWNSEAPAWYSKGADVDELLHEADALDWLADSGDLNETYEPATVTVSAPAPASSSEDNGEQHQQAVAAAARVVAEVQGQPYEQHQMQHQGSTMIMGGYNTGSMHLPPSLPSLTSKSIGNSSELVQQFNTSGVNNHGSGNVEATAPSIHQHPVSMSVNMPPLPSLFESGNSINVLNEMKRKDSSICIGGAGNISSASLFVTNDTPDGFFGDGTLEEEEFVTSLLD